MNKALFLALALATPTAWADEWVVGAGVGQAESDVDCHAYTSSGLTSHCDDTDTDYKVSIAYWWDYLGLEVAYYDLGDISRDSQGTVNGEAVTLSEEYNADGILYAVAGRLPINDQFEVIGRAGRIRYTADVRLRASTQTLGADGVNDDHEGSAGMFGIGVRYRIMPELSITGEYEQTNDIKIRNVDLGDGSTFNTEADVKIFNITASYHF